MAISAYIKKLEKYQINDLTMHTKYLEEKEAAKPILGRRK